MSDLLFELKHSDDGVAPLVEAIVDMIVDSGTAYGNVPDILNWVEFKLAATTRPFKIESSADQAQP